jgi:hypothetical protein
MMLFAGFAKGWWPMLRKLDAMRWALVAVCGAAAALMCAAAAAAGPTTAPAGGPSDLDQISFQQKNAQAQMQELQERMYRLADLTRQSEPDDSARLLLAVRKAREDLIVEDMRSLIDTLGRQDFGRASADEKQVLVKLEELRRLLTTTDLDLQLRLEQLRKLNQAISKLDAAIKEEHRERKQSGQLAEQQQKKALDLPAVARAQQDQQHNRRSTESIAQTIKDLGPMGDKAGGLLGAACLSMSLAEGHLSGNQPGNAEPKQGDAAGSLEQARAELDAQRQKLLQELEHQVRTQVVQNLTEMLDRQMAVRGATESLRGRTSQSAEAAAVRLGPSEQAIVRICDSTIELIDETDFSIALPPMLADVRAECARVQTNLEAEDSGPPVVAREKQVEQDLQDLLDTFKQLANARMGDGQCNCKGDKNKLLAELRVLRLMEKRVETGTQAADAQRGGSAELNDDMQQEVIGVRDRQVEAHDVAARIRHELGFDDSDGNN